MNYKILVVDDEPQIQTFMRISLAAEGFDYVGADSIAMAMVSAFYRPFAHQAKRLC